MAQITTSLTPNPERNGFSLTIDCSNMTEEDVRSMLERAKIPAGQGLNGTLRASSFLDAVELIVMYTSACSGNTLEVAQHKTRQAFLLIVAQEALRMAAM